MNVTATVERRQATATIEYLLDGRMSSATVPAVWLKAKLRCLARRGARILSITYHLGDGAELEIVPATYNRCGMPLKGYVQRVESSDAHWRAAIRQLILDQEPISVVLPI